MNHGDKSYHIATRVCKVTAFFYKFKSHVKLRFIYIYIYIFEQHADSHWIYTILKIENLDKVVITYTYQR